MQTPTTTIDRPFARPLAEQPAWLRERHNAFVTEIAAEEQDRGRELSDREWSEIFDRHWVGIYREAEARGFV